jgi:DNA primase
MYPAANYDCVIFTSTAPQIFAPRGYGLAADVYSLGVLMWEALCSTPQRASSNPLVGLDPDEGVAQVRVVHFPPR